MVCTHADRRTEPACDFHQQANAASRTYVFSIFQQFGVDGQILKRKVMKKFLYCFMVCLTLFGCAIDPVEEKRQEQARLQEERRKASLSPKQKCMEEADYDKKYCDVQCALSNLGAGSPPGFFNNCSSNCTRTQLTASQICQYK